MKTNMDLIRSVLIQIGVKGNKEDSLRKTPRLHNLIKV